MSEPTVKTSISLDKDVLEEARKKVKGTGQSVSSLINVLLRQDLQIPVSTKNPRRAKAAA